MGVKVASYSAGVYRGEYALYRGTSPREVHALLREEKLEPQAVSRRDPARGAD